MKKSLKERVPLLAAVSDWLKLLALIVLVVEAMLGVTIAVTKKPDPYMAYGMLLFALIIVGVIFDRYISHKTGTKVPEKPIEIINNIKTLETIGQIRNFLPSVFNIDRPPRRLWQTFIHSNTVSPKKDLLRKFLSLSGEKKPFIERIIQIASPRDILFAQHSVDFAMEYGADRMTVSILTGTSSEEITGIFPNFTIADDVSLITFPLRKDVKDISRILPNDSTASSGLVLYDKLATERIKEYLEFFIKRTDLNKPDTPINHINNRKKEFWNNNNKKYLIELSSIISNELEHCTEVSKKLFYIGIVGSIIDESTSGDQLNDLDIVLTLREITADTMEFIRSLVNEILMVYSIPGVVKLVPFYSACPLKPQLRSSSEFPIQFLVYNETEMKDWSSFISSHRKANHIDLYNCFPEGIGRDGFTIQELLDDSYYGIRACKRHVKLRRVPGKKWDYVNGRLSYIQYNETIDDDVKYQEFLRYVVRWTIKNLFLASNCPLASNETSVKGQRNHLYNQLKLTHNEIANLENLLNKTPSVNDDDVIKSVNNFLEALEHYCEHLAQE